jgi:hypothetical protein
MTTTSSLLSRFWYCAAVIIATLLVAAPSVRAEHEEENPYGKKGALEVGGNVRLEWGEDTFDAAVGPTLGYFFADRLELSTLLTFDFSRDSTGPVREFSRGGDFLIEPSYHHPFTPTVFGEVAVGGGIAWDPDSVDPEVVPKVGMNFDIGNATVLTPAFRLPIVFEEGDTQVGFDFLIGFSAAM